MDNTEIKEDGTVHELLRVENKYTHKATGMNLYRIRSSTDPNKGLAMFAAQDIPRGTRILTTEPLLWTDAQNDMLQVYTQFCELPLEVQFQVFSLHASTHIIREWQDRLSLTPLAHMTNLSHMVHIIAIFETNCIQLGDSETGGNGLFFLPSRINHSCTPNAQHAWNANIERQTVHATRHIPAGEELTFSYTSPTASRDERQRALRPWGFTCTCAVCDESAAASRASQERRRMIDETARFLMTMHRKVERRSPTLERAPRPETFLEGARVVIGLLHEEGLEGDMLAAV